MMGPSKQNSLVSLWQIKSLCDRVLENGKGVEQKKVGR